MEFKEYCGCLEVDGLTIHEQIEFERYLNELYEEGWWDTVKKGAQAVGTGIQKGAQAVGAGAQAFGQQYQQGYQQGATAQTPEMMKKVQEMASKAYPAAQQLSQKMGIPISLTLALIVSGAIGGPAAMPITALTYYLRKPVVGAAGKAFDAAAQKMGMAQPQPAVAAEGVEDWAKAVGGFAGKMTGKAAGTARRYAGHVGSVIKNNFSAIKDFAMKNKLKVAKGAFLIGVGALVGMGVNALTPDAISDVVSGVQDGAAGQIPAEEIQELQSQVGAQITPDEIEQGYAQAMGQPGAGDAGAAAATPPGGDVGGVDLKNFWTTGANSVEGGGAEASAISANQATAQSQALNKLAQHLGTNQIPPGTTAQVVGGGSANPGMWKVIVTWNPEQAAQGAQAAAEMGSGSLVQPY